MRLDVKLHQAPRPLASLPLEPPFTGAHIIGLHPFRVTPTRSSTIIDPLRVLDRGEPPHLVYPVYSNVCPTWVFTLNPHLGHSQVSANSLQQRKIAQNPVNLNETQIQLSRLLYGTRWKAPDFCSLV